MRRLALFGLVILLLLRASDAAGQCLSARPAGAILQRAAGTEVKGAASKSVTYRGTQVDVETGLERDFAIVAQRGDQLLYVLWEPDGKVQGIWGYQRGRAWAWQPEGEIAELTGDSVQSWRVLALLLSPNRYSGVSRKALRCEVVATAPPSDPVLRVNFEGGLELLLTIRRKDHQLVKVNRVSGGVRRTTTFLNTRIVDGTMRFDGLQSLRDDVPYRLYRIERATYGDLRPDPFFSHASLAELPLLRKEAR